MQARTKALLVLATTATLACTGSTDPEVRSDTLQPGQPVEVDLAVGDDLVVPGSILRVTFTRVVDDSRCPVDVTCVWEGNAGVELGLALGSGPTVPYVLNTTLEPTAVTAGVYTLTLVAVEPAPVSTQTIAPDAYRIRLRIEI